MESDRTSGTAKPAATAGGSGSCGPAWPGLSRPGQSARNGASEGAPSERSRPRACSARPVNAPSESMVHYTSPRETLAFRPERDSDARSAACFPRSAFLDVCRGVVAWLLDILDE